MCNTGLVSIISPCYNVAPYLPYFFESLLGQTYRRLEIIIVNDGSTDNTDQVIKEWLPRLENTGYLTKYIVKENGGQSSAINLALQYFTGEFLTWPDPDDFLFPDSIKERVEFLLKNNKFGIVRSAADVYHEADREKVVGHLHAKKTVISAKDFFEDVVFARTYFAPICYMVRSSAFIATIPSRRIYSRKDAGQNWQMLLPVAAKFDCGYLPTSLCGYLIRNNSHSHAANDLVEKLNYLNMCLDVLQRTLRPMNLWNNKYEKALNIQYSTKRYHIGLNFKNYNLVSSELQYLDKLNGLTLIQKVIKVLCIRAVVFYEIVVPIWILFQLLALNIRTMVIKLKVRLFG